VITLHARREPGPEDASRQQAGPATRRQSIAKESKGVGRRASSSLSCTSLCSSRARLASDKTQSDIAASADQVTKRRFRLLRCRRVRLGAGKHTAPKECAI